MTWIQNSLARFPFDFFVGSVHHVHTIPIDYDTLLYQKARGIAGGTDERLFEDYFDAQLAMLKALNPPVVGHFDLIRLKSDDPERSFQQWPAVWEKILRNLDYMAEYGGILELNSASLRKGMTEPYPKAEICKVNSKFRITFKRNGNVTRQSPPLITNKKGVCFRNFSHGMADSVCQMTAMVSNRLPLIIIVCSSS